MIGFEHLIGLTLLACVFLGACLSFLVQLIIGRVRKKETPYSVGPHEYSGQMSRVVYDASRSISEIVLEMKDLKATVMVLEERINVLIDREGVSVGRLSG